MIPTIRTVAAKAGVSLSTVSRVLNNSEYVNEITRTRVENAIKDLDYSPNNIARSLKSRKTWLIGVVVDDISNQFFMQLVTGIEHVVNTQDYNIIIANSEGLPEKENKVISRFLQRCVDGLIVITCQSEHAVFDQVKENRVPIVLVDRYIKNAAYDAVLEDNELNSRELVKHLLNYGHRRICIVNGLMKVSPEYERQQGYLKAHSDMDITVDERLIINCPFGITLENKVRDIMTKLPRDDVPSAIFATSNLRCEPIVKILNELNLRVPDDVSLVTYGNISNPWMFYCRLTHIPQDGIRIGKKTGEVILDMLSGENPPHVKEHILYTDVVFGDSVKVLNI